MKVNFKSLFQFLNSKVSYLEDTLTGKQFHFKNGETLIISEIAKPRIELKIKSIEIDESSSIKLSFKDNLLYENFVLENSEHNEFDDMESDQPKILPPRKYYLRFLSSKKNESYIVKLSI